MANASSILTQKKHLESVIRKAATAKDRAEKYIGRTNQCPKEWILVLEKKIEIYNKTEIAAKNQLQAGANQNKVGALGILCQQAEDKILKD